MKRTIMTPVTIGAAVVLGLTGCGGDDVGEGTVVEEVTAVSTETEVAEVEEEVTVEPTATVTRTDDVEVEVTETATETDVEFDPEATQELDDLDP